MMKTATGDTPVIDLMNIGKKIAARLNEVDVYTKNDLEKIGAVTAHQRIKAVYPGETLAVCYYLYSFEGAILGMHWNDLPEQRKAELKNAIQE